MVDLLQIIENVVAAISPGGGGLTSLFYVISWLIGLIFVILALRGFAQTSELGRQSGGWSNPFWSLVVGICFIALPGLIGSLTMTIFQAKTPSAEEIFAYAPVTVGLFDPDSAGRKVITGIITIVQFVGVIAVMRGLYLLRVTAQGGGGGPRTFGPGMTFVIAGVLSVNFPLAVGVVENLVTSS